MRRQVRKSVIQDFTYDGLGPDTFFLASTVGSLPSELGDIVLPLLRHFSIHDSLRDTAYSNPTIPVRSPCCRGDFALRAILGSHPMPTSAFKKAPS